MKNNKKYVQIASFPIFSTLTLSQLYLFSALPIFIEENTKNKHFPFFHFNLKSALPIFIDENTSLASFPYFFKFNLKSALPIFIDENTKIIFRNKLALFPIFSTLTLGQLYLFSSMKIPRTHMKSLHFRFFLSYWA